MAAICGMQFGLVTDQKARDHGVVHVTEPALHAKGVPRANGPTDVRFGSCSRLNPCGTCKETIENCSSHPGYIALPIPLQHIGVLDHCVKFMNMYCFNCSRFLLPDLELPPHVNTPKKKVAFYFDEAKKARGWKRNPLMCPCCGLPQPMVRVEEPFFRLEFYDDALAKHFGEDVLAEVKPGRRRQPKKKKKPPKLAALEAKLAALAPDSDEWRDVQAEVAALQPDEPPPPTAEELADRAARRARYDEFEKRFIARPFSNWDAYNVLRGITAEDLARLGINAEHTHPSGMMLLSLVVPGIAVRPTVAFEEGSKRPGYHLLTKKLSEIVKLVRSVKLEAENAKVDLSDPFHVADYPDDLLNAIVALAFAVSTYLIKDKTKIKIKLSQYAARAHARFQALAQNLQGKRGRFRNTCMGKRVDFCFRAVVTTDPNADIDVVGVPRVLARRLTVPIRVSANNRQQVVDLIRAGDVKQLVDERTGDMIDVNDENRDALAIMDGMVAERFLSDGDYVVINRQPTLHRPSFMAYRVKLHDDRTIKLPPPGTIPFNADHDGDEMNGHVPQTLEARTEVIELMGVTHHVMHPRANKPSMGLIQDALDAGYFMTRQATLLTEAEAMRLLACVWYDRDADARLALGSAPSRRLRYELPPPAVEWPVRRWTGKQIVSQAIPRITMDRKLSNRPQVITEADPLLAADGHLLIHDGELLRGTLCKQTLGNTAGGIVHVAAVYVSNEAAVRALSDLQRVLNKFLITEGFSIGIRDCVCSPAIHRKVTTILEAAERHVGAIEATAAEVPDDAEVQEVAESKIQETLQSALTMVGNVVRATLGDDNMFNLMSVIAGSKGSPFNMAQVMGLVGQTFVNGRRPVADGSDRVLPNAPLPGQPPLKGRAALMALGLVVRSYLTGMTPAEAFLHNMGGREGLVDTAAKTSGTGYGQRRLVKAMEGTVVTQDGSVRHTNGVLFQRHYGNDGLDPQKCTRVLLRSLLLSDAELRARCVADDAGPAEAAVFEAAFEKLVAVRQQVRKARVTAYLPNLEQNVDVYLPFDMQQLIAVRRARCGCVDETLPPADLAEVEALVDALCGRIQAELPSSFLAYHLRDELSSGRLQKHHRVCRACAVGVCREAERLHREARMHVGENVGCNSAISLGEPQSQMTMNCVAYDTRFALIDDGAPKAVPIGAFVDAAFAEAAPGTVETHPNGSQYLPLSRPVLVQSCDDAGVVQWDTVEGVSRHPHAGELVKIITDGGRSATVTPGESVLTYDGARIVPTRADAVTVAHAMPVTFRSAPSGVVTPTATLEDGSVIHLDATYGTQLGAQCRENRYNRFAHVLRHLHTAPDECVRAFLDAFCRKQASGVQDTFIQHGSHDLLDHVQALLASRCGIYSRIRKNLWPCCSLTIVDSDGAAAPPRCNDVVLEKVAACKRVAYAEPFTYDLTVSRTRNMQQLDGLNVRDTFHFAGTANAGITQGVPRFREVIAASKNMATPAMTLPLKPGLGEPAAQLLARCLPYTQLQNIVLSCDPVYEPDLLTTHVADDAAMVAEHRPFLEHVQADASHWVIRFVLSKMRATARSLEPAGVADLIQNEVADGGIVLSADVEAEVWAIRVYLIDVAATVEHALQRSLKSGTTKAAAKRASTQRPSLSASKRRRKYPDLSDMGAATTIAVPLHEYDPHIGTTEHTPRAVIERKVIEYARDDLLKTRVCGIRNITMARVRPVQRTLEQPDGSMKTVAEPIIDVRGCNIPECAKLPMVDRPRILTNNIMAVYNTMGITAAAHTLFYELRECLAGAGTRVDERLLQILVSHMCHGGFVMPITRHGLNRLARHGVITKAMFEETIEMVFEAAVYGSFDELKGVSENIFIGRKARMGTAIGETLVMHDGKLEPALKAHTNLAVASTETRVLCSVITEERAVATAADDNDEAALPNVLGWDRLDSVLRVEPLPGGEQKPTIETGLPPMPPGASDAPFRPASPTVTTEEMLSTTAASRKPFRPASPRL